MHECVHKTSTRKKHLTSLTATTEQTRYTKPELIHAQISFLWRVASFKLNSTSTTEWMRSNIQNLVSLAEHLLRHRLAFLHPFAKIKQVYLRMVFWGRKEALLLHCLMRLVPSQSWNSDKPQRPLHSRSETRTVSAAWRHPTRLIIGRCASF